jgi:hypothetical protein
MKLRKMLDESLTSLFVSPIVSFGNEYSKKEKETFSKEFNEIDIGSWRSCYDLVKRGVLKLILSCLPRKYDDNVDVSLTTTILKRFALMSLELICSGIDEHLKCVSEMKKINGDEFLFHCFNTYPNIIHKQYIVVILCQFHGWIACPPKYLINIIMLRDIIRS